MVFYGKAQTTLLVVDEAVYYNEFKQASFAKA